MFTKQRTGVQGKFPLYFGFFMAALYFTGALYIVFSNSVTIEPSFRYLLGFIFLSYAVMRFFRSRTKWKEHVCDTDE